MRHTYTNRVVLLITLLLIGMAVLFASVRSSASPASGAAARDPSSNGIPESPDPATAPATQPVQSPQATQPSPWMNHSAWFETGQRVYVSDCADCHASREPGRTVPRALQASVEKILTTETGREDLINVLLHGRGITRRRHPAFDELSNAELAAVLNFMQVGARDTPPPGEPYTPEQIAVLRKAKQ